MHARIEDGRVVEYPIINLRQRLPEASLPADLTDDAALPEGYVYVRPPVGAVPFDALRERLVEGAPQLVGEHWVRQYVVQPLSTVDAAAARDRAALQVDAARAKAYREESDPLFFKWQRGEATQQEWLDKVSEIKARFPEIT